VLVLIIAHHGSMPDLIRPAQLFTIKPVCMPASCASPLPHAFTIRHKAKRRSTMNHTETPDRFLRVSEVMAKVGLAETALYSLMQKGMFPRPVKIGTRALRWSERELDQWMQARMIERDAAPCEVIELARSEDDEDAPAAREPKKAQPAKSGPQAARGTR
jgi:prophage regulatory protein